MKLKTSFELLIPMCHSRGILDAPELEAYFSPCTLSRTAQLEGRPLLDPRTTPLVGCYELHQSKRLELGLHGNEGHTYTLVKEDIPFDIRKLRLWLFRCGVGFLSIHVDTAELEAGRILDLVSGLSGIRANRKIRFLRSLDKNTRVEQVFTLRSLLKKLFRLLGDELVQPMDGETYQQAHCLFYGVGDAADEQAVFSFLEMLRCQHKSTQSPAGYDAEQFFRPYAYLTWAVSQRVLAAVGDLNTGRENAGFLSDSNGFVCSVFQNYLPVYLNMLAASLRVKRLHMQYALFDAAAAGALPDDASEALRGVLNTALYEATNVSHINLLFDRCLAEKTLGLPQKLRTLSEAGMRQPRPEDRAELSDDGLICDILRACEKIQSNISYRGVYEDVRNRGIRDILDQKHARYTVHDQSQQGESGQGHGPGELDILFKRPDRSQWTIFEGLNIERGFSDRKKWEEHLFKLLYRYDKKGNSFLVLTAYVECDTNSWTTVWNRYLSHMSTYCPDRVIQREHAAENVHYQVVQDSCALYAPAGYKPGNHMRIARCTYEIGGQRSDVIHIFVRLDSAG